MIQTVSVKAKVLFIAGNEISRETIDRLSHTVDVQVLSEGNRSKLQKELGSNHFEVCILRSKELGHIQYDLMQYIRTQWPMTRVIVSVESASVEEAVRYIKAGAADFLVGDAQDSRLLQ